MASGRNQLVADDLPPDLEGVNPLQVKLGITSLTEYWTPDSQTDPIQLPKDPFGPAASVPLDSSLLTAVQTTQGVPMTDANFVKRKRSKAHSKNYPRENNLFSDSRRNQSLHPALTHPAELSSPPVPNWTNTQEKVIGMRHETNDHLSNFNQVQHSQNRSPFSMDDLSSSQYTSMNSNFMSGLPAGDDCHSDRYTPSMPVETSLFPGSDINSSNSYSPVYANLENVESTTFGTFGAPLSEFSSNELFGENQQILDEKILNESFYGELDYLNLSPTSSSSDGSLYQEDSSSSSYDQGRFKSSERLEASSATTFGLSAQQLVPASVPSASGAKKRPQKNRNKLKTSEYAKLSEEEKLNRKLQLNNMCSKEYNQRKKELYNLKKQEFDVESNNNAILRNQLEEKKKHVKILKKALNHINRN